MDHPQTVRGRRVSEIALLDESDRQAAKRRIPGDAYTIDSPANDQKIKYLT
jgi:hypothetical protein